ncbi:phosphosulfolactate synthase [Amycolatopsis echigonensis]|uniref:phosphosulfolactate synthase n=1 Tax=Amycolatopsis echigonensis TaxID=2576905 RepID=UPI0028AC10FB|nr:phosphosulfolactate synthase [Amycolatopsis echigonensis]
MRASYRRWCSTICGRCQVSGCPSFLDLPARTVKPRMCGVTHVLDKGLTVAGTEAFLDQAGQLADIVKIGWGIGYVDPTLAQRVRRYTEHGCGVSLGGTLLEICALQNRVRELREWALRSGISHVEVSNGLRALTVDRKRALIRELSADFVVLAETGAKDDTYPSTPDEWAEEMAGDLDAGARWLVAEGRESGTVGIYDRDHGIRSEVITAILRRVPVERVIFEAPEKNQQAWFIRKLGFGANLGNIAPADALSLETLRLGLRADTVPFDTTVEASA